MKNMSRNVLVSAMLTIFFTGALLAMEVGAETTRCTALIHIGDSTTISMQKYLKNDYEWRGFTKVTISAGNGRSITGKRAADRFTGLEAVNYWKQRTPSGRCWVIALGTNDMSSSNKNDRIALLTKAIGDDRSIWVNVSVNYPNRKHYNGLNAYAWNYYLIQNKVDIFDWASHVQTSWFSPDGIHYTTEGSKNRSTLIAEAAREAFSL